MWTYYDNAHYNSSTTQSLNLELGLHLSYFEVHVFVCSTLPYLNTTDTGHALETEQLSAFVLGSSQWRCHLMTASPFVVVN